MPKSNQMYQLVLSVIIGVLSSLGAQGIWMAIYAWITGNIIDQFFGLIMVLSVVAFGLDVVVIFWLRSMLKKDTISEHKETDGEIMAILKTVLSEQQKTNDNLKRLEKGITVKTDQNGQNNDSQTIGQKQLKPITRKQWSIIFVLSLLISGIFFILSIPFGIFLLLSVDSLKALIEGIATLLGFFGLVAIYLLTSYDSRIDKLDEKIQDLDENNPKMAKFKALQESIKIKKVIRQQQSLRL
jgi:hypothetical protein